MLGGLIAVLFVAVLVAAGAPSSLGLPLAERSGSESATANDGLAAALHREADPGMVIVTHGGFPVRSGVYRVPLDVISSQVKAQTEVAAVRRGPVSDDERTTALEVYFHSRDEAAQQHAVDEIDRGLDPGPLSALVGGQEAVAVDARQAAAHDLGRLELLAVPIALIVLLATLGIRLAAGPILVSGTAIIGALALLRVAGWIADVSVLGILPGAAIGLTLGVEFCIAFASRYREEARQLRDAAAALHRTIETTGRTILLAAIVAAGGAAGFLLLPIMQARSAALGGALAALLAGGATLAAMPPLVALYGGGFATGGAEEEQEPRWRRVARTMVRRPRTSLVAGALAAAALVAVATPLLRGETLVLGASALPQGAESRRAEARATKELGAGVTAPALVAGAPERRSDAVRLSRRLRRIDGVASATRPKPAGADLQLIRAGLDAAPESLAARNAVDLIRGAPAPYATSVGGHDAAALDANRTLFDWLPFGALAAALLVATLLFWLVARPAPLSLALGASALLPAAAAGGLLVLVFQDDRLSGALDYAGEGAVQLGALVALIAALVPITAARGALFVAACAERRSAGPETAVQHGLSLMLPAAVAASVIGAAAGAVLVGSALVPLKELGLGVAAGLLLDVILMRGLLTPSLARLLPPRQP
jgi:putative drug exporter of the RND superfamily